MISRYQITFKTDCYDITAEGASSAAAAPPHQGVNWGGSGIWWLMEPPSGGLSGTFHLEETPGQTQDFL